MTDPYRIRSPETWDAAREAYLTGLSAEEVCERFDLGLSALRKRARTAKWRRSDQADPDPLDDHEPDDDVGDDLPDMDDQALADLAFRKMSVEARRGRLARALAWGRLRDMALRQAGTRAAVQARVDRAARSDTMDTLQRLSETTRILERQANLVRSIAARQRPDTDGDAAPEVHEVHEVHPVHPLSRAQRRRLEAIQKKTGPP